MSTGHDGRPIATNVRNEHEQPVDEAARKRVELAEAWATKDRTPLLWGSDTFVGRKDTNEDRAICLGKCSDEAGAGNAGKHNVGVQLDFGKWFGVVRCHLVNVLCHVEYAESLVTFVLIVPVIHSTMDMAVKRPQNM